MRELRAQGITGMRLARKHLAWYSKGLPGSAEFRVRVNHAEDPAATEAGYIQEGDFVRLREISATYSLPSSLLARAGAAIDRNPRTRRWIEGSTGAALIGFGVRLATAGR